jgi:hypothetical protein
MSATDHIHYLQRHEIDPVKWDACIEAAPNGLIYGRSFYLDAMTAGQWDALVLDDYRAVMPLPWNRKFGFYYLYQPFCTPCLGIFGPGPQGARDPGATTPSPEHPVTAFLRSIPKKFKFWDIDLNETNLLSDSTDRPMKPPAPPLKITARVNHFLDLNKKKEELEQAYNRLAKRMCKRAETESIDIIRDIGPRDVIDMYRKEYGRRHAHIKAKIYDRMAICAEKAFTKGLARTYLALIPDEGIAAFYLLLSDKKFVYSALGGSTQKGKLSGAFYLLTDAAIKDHAESPRIFRFEGSDTPGIASFDASFGSRTIHYPHLLMNNLPFPINYLK